MAKLEQCHAECESKPTGCTLSCTDGMTDEQRVVQVPPYVNFVEMEDKKKPRSFISEDKGCGTVMTTLHISGINAKSWNCFILRSLCLYNQFHIL